MRRYVLTCLTAAMLLALAETAAADQEFQSAAQTAAVLSFTKDDSTYSDLRLTIARAGQVLHDAPVRAEGCDDEFCGPAGFGRRRSLTVGDLDGDAEPEVVVSLYSGGAHCCSFAQVYSLNAQATGYSVVTQAFGNMGFSLLDVDGQGEPEFRSADDRFSYRFTCFACSGNPVRIYRFEQGRFAERTALYGPAVRADSRRWYRIYRQRRGREDVRGVLAAWAANEYRLGHAAGVRRELRRAVRRGWLAAKDDFAFGRHGNAYVRELRRFLRRTGYTTAQARVRR